MDPVIALAIDCDFSAIVTLIEKCDCGLFDKVQGVCGFDILIQHAVDSQFHFKHEIYELFKFYSEKFSVNLKQAFLGSPLVSVINSKRGQFYFTVKNVLKFLHSIDKSKVTYKELIRALFDAFREVPKDAISLIKYMMNNDMFDNDIEPQDFTLIFACSPKLFGWMLSKLDVEPDNTDFFEEIFYYLFLKSMLDSNSEGYITKMLGRYFAVFKKYKNLFTNNEAITFSKSAYHSAAIKAITNYINMFDGTGSFSLQTFLNLREILIFFELEFNFVVTTPYVMDIIKKISDPNLKFFLTSSFNNLQFSCDEQDQLFENFILSLQNISQQDRLNLIHDYILLFPYLEAQYKQEWNELNSNNHNIAQHKNDDFDNLPDIYDDDFDTLPDMYDDAFDNLPDIHDDDLDITEIMNNCLNKYANYYIGEYSKYDQNDKLKELLGDDSLKFDANDDAIELKNMQHYTNQHWDEGYNLEPEQDKQFCEDDSSITSDSLCYPSNFNDSNDSESSDDECHDINMTDLSNSSSKKIYG